MNARQSPTPAPGPDLLARYLNAYLQARQMSDVERPWGLGDDALDSLWVRLTEALASDPQRLDRIVAEELSAAERERVIETLAPLIFALPLRSYPAELRAVRRGPRLILSLRHLPPSPGSKADHVPHHHAAPEIKSAGKKTKDKEKENIDSVGFLPAALTDAFSHYLRNVLHWPDDRHRSVVTISSGGRRRRVRVTILARSRGVIVRFLERLQSPVDDVA
jgi:hypothetical protein